MTEQSNGSPSPRTISLLIAVAVAAMISVFASMATSLAIRDLQASQHQVIDQLKALQADMKRLSDEVAALNAASARPQVSPLSAPPRRRNVALDSLRRPFLWPWETRWCAFGLRAWVRVDPGRKWEMQLPRPVRAPSPCCRE